MKKATDILKDRYVKGNILRRIKLWIMVKFDSIRYANWRWPYLYIHIAIPFCTIRTALMYERMEAETLEYIALQIHIYKWYWDIHLYSPRRYR